MRYVIVSVVKGKLGNFNNNLRKEIFNKFKAKSSKLPAHFTIKSPFETDNIDDLENILDSFSNNYLSEPYKIKGYAHFDNRVIFMKVLMSDEGKILHDKLIDELSKIPYINFGEKDGKDKVFHITISSKKIQKIFNELWEYVNKIDCDFDCHFDNICIYKWENNTWILHNEYILKNLYQD
ncbi:2'-5' RNA ligase family protein [Clostridium sp. CCUG 7971]|uniref:2'-5' RNA ligase family protein n=1 Tax=Clostridium sp. CCUG 7971 TaxID=2811414 RepID=UPI001ABAC982|nr:2'-5' RNA ligase family protein [Clostridium sp. CCUG 7971]MBO3444119.1 2'-5' RNA ligase family protein [Clostridium sp. CCUG 7971]